MAGMEPHPDTTALGPMLTTSAAIVLLDLREQLFVWRRSVCRPAGFESRSGRRRS